MEDVIKKAGILIEAIPYIHSFRRKVFVIKYGGSILDNDAIRRNVLQDIVFLSYVGIRTILVHGGGPRITSRVREQGIEANFYNGIRVTDKDTLEIVHEELNALNDKIVKEIKELKGDVTAIKADEGIINAEKKESSKDLGFVGAISTIHKDGILQHLKKGHIAVVAPMGMSSSGQLFNINGDEVASGIAHELDAEKLVLLTNVQGVLRDQDDDESLISTLTLSEIDNLIAMNVISGGMIPKVNACIEGLKAGVKKTHIIDARIQHALLLEFFTTKGVGTQILNG